MWVAGWNMPGCLPEMQPETFDSWDEANNYIVQELSELTDMDEPTAEYALSEWNKEPVNDSRRIMLFPYLYWIERAHA
jgi:hypothetical protein